MFFKQKTLLIVLFAFCSCIIASTEQRKADEAVKLYTEDLFNRPRYFVPVSFSALERKRYITSLDSSLNYAHISDRDNKKMEHYVDSENYQRPDRASQNIKQLDSIENNRLYYYVIDFAFRIDSFGHKKLKKYHFELDTAYRVIKATDVSYGRDTRLENP